jgi:ABC-type dipeptide/oligopeptide/nickel transport systems, permease components
MPKPVLLWTDLLVFVLVVAVAGCAWYAAKYEHLRAPWRGVLRNRLSMAAAVILGAFVAIGLLDSVHFRPPLASGQADRETHYSSQVLSLLDFLAGPLRKHHETTYSAPFATHLYTRERARLPEGTEVQVYPRLRYGGAHLTDPARDRGRDILARALQGSAQGIALWAGITWLLAAAVARRQGSSVGEVLRSIGAGRTEVPWRVILLMAFVIIVIAALAANLAPKYHIFGTDKVGEDVFYQTLKSIRTGLIIGTLTTLIMLPFAIVLGIMAGYFSGWVDDAIQYLYTTLNSIPGVLLIAAAVLMLDIYMANHEHLFESTMVRADLRLLFLCIILGITSWTGLCRLLRGETLKVRELDYVQAATALGVSHFTIIGHHILPNVMHIVLITVVLDFSGLVLAEAVLSYVGVGIDPTMNSWGNMINSARLELAREPVVWWTLAAAFLFMFTLVLAANLFSDAVRDAFDPRLRSQ